MIIIIIIKYSSLKNGLNLSKNCQDDSWYLNKFPSWCAGVWPEMCKVHISLLDSCCPESCPPWMSYDFKPKHTM